MTKGGKGTDGPANVPIGVLLPGLRIRLGLFYMHLLLTGRSRAAGALVTSAHLSSLFSGRKQPSYSRPSLQYSFAPNMESTRNADRSQLIRFSMVVFAVLALVSFALARVVA
jgi:hypothetical protein